MEGEWSCYRGGKFKGGRMVMFHLNAGGGGVGGGGGRMVMLQRWFLMEGAWSCYRADQYNGGRMVMLRRWSVS